MYYHNTDSTPTCLHESTKGNGVSFSTTFATVSLSDFFLPKTFSFTFLDIYVCTKLHTRGLSPFITHIYHCLKPRSAATNQEYIVTVDYYSTINISNLTSLY